MKKGLSAIIGMSIAFILLAILVGFSTVQEIAAQMSPTISSCSVFPPDNIWNTPIDTLPVDSNSAQYISTIGPRKAVHPDFGSGLWEGGPIGIPYNLVPGTQMPVPIVFEYEDESDAGPYPIPPNAFIEGGNQSGGDRHVLVVDMDTCILYETWSTYPLGNGTWKAGSGAIFDLNSNALRPEGWTSSDAAGLPILPGLARYDEVASGEIRHALRFTAPQTRKESIWPARHYASNLTGTQYPPMGQRFRLKSSFDVSGFSLEVQVILRCLKKYGMILADNGSAWYLSGAPDARWNNGILVGELSRVTGSDFEAVDESSLMVHPDSALASGVDQPNLTVTPGSFDFGSVYLGSQTPAETFALSNTGTADLQMGLITLTGTNLSEFNVVYDSCSNQIIPPSSGCTLNVVFIPKSEGSKTANLSVPSNDPDASTKTVSMNGNALGQNGITVTSPNGGETLKVGTLVSMTWTYEGTPGRWVKIQLVRGTTVIQTIKSKVSTGSNGRGSFMWKIPRKLTAASDFRIQITSTTNQTYTDSSDNVFSIGK